MAGGKNALYRERLSRYKTAMEAGKPDKVPIRLTLFEFSAKYAGLTLQEVYYQLDKNYEAAEKVMSGFDMDAFLGPPSMWWAGLHDAVGARYLRFAGRDFDENTHFQYHEEDFMKVEDYDAFIKNPTEWIATTYLPRLHKEGGDPGSYRSTISIIKGAWCLSRQTQLNRQMWRRWADIFGAVPNVTGISKAPFDTLGDTLRGLRGVMTDIRRHPDKVLAAMDTLVAHNVYFGMITAEGDTEFPLFLPLHRGSHPFLSMDQWEKFYWPTLKKVIETLWARGKRTLFYAEGNWTPYLEKIAELPEKSIVFHVDMTDMARAADVFRGRFCISGNVPNTLLAFGKPGETRDYVKRLIDDYAADGGFILDAAAVIQADAQIDNIRELVETAREYGVYR